MKPSECFNAIAELLEQPVTAFERDGQSAKKIAVARKDTAAELERTRALREALEQYHPGVMLQKLARREVAIALRQDDIRRAEDQLVAAAGAAPDEESTKQRIAELMHREQMLMRQSSVSGAGGPSSTKVLPMKFVRADATEHFRREYDEASAEREKLLKHFAAAPPNTSPGPRLSERMRQLDETIGKWTSQTAQLCALGEKIFGVRQEIQQLRAEQEQRQQERRREVLAV